MPSTPRKRRARGADAAIQDSPFSISICRLIGINSIRQKTFAPIKELPYDEVKELERTLSKSLMGLMINYQAPEDCPPD
jgi:hypothetical protein